MAILSDDGVCADRYCDGWAEGSNPFKILMLSIAIDGGVGLEFSLVVTSNTELAKLIRVAGWFLMIFPSSSASLSPSRMARSARCMTGSWTNRLSPFDTRLSSLQDPFGAEE